MENFVHIQNELKVPKGNYNSFGKYKYRSAEDILEAVKPILNKYNALLVLSDEIVQVGNKVFLKATATINIDNKIALFSFVDIFLCSCWFAWLWLLAICIGFGFIYKK